MFSNKLVYAIIGILIFLTVSAFIMGRPSHRDKRIYPIVRQYTPFVIENGLGGLKIKRKDNPSFKEEPDAVNFYHRLNELERDWAKTHLRVTNNTLEILDNNGTVLQRVKLKNQNEKKFIKNYYGVANWRIEGDNFVSPNYTRPFHLARCIVDKY